MDNRQVNSILIVDDDEANRNMLSIIMSIDGHQIDTAVNGKLALEKIKNNSYDLILLDLMMPVIDGYQVLHFLQDDEKLRDIPVLVITAVGKRESVTHCVSLGAKDYLLKPFDQEIVRSRVKSVITSSKVKELEMAVSELVVGGENLARDIADVVIPSGLQLFYQADGIHTLKSMIVEKAVELFNADAGILYMKVGDDALEVEIVYNRPLGIALGGAFDKPSDYPTIPLLHQGGEANLDDLVSQAFHSGKPASVDISNSPIADSKLLTTNIFEGHDAFKIVSLMASPVLAIDDQVVGVLELVNIRDQGDNKVIPVDNQHEAMVRSFCRIAAVAVDRLA